MALPHVPFIDDNDYNQWLAFPQRLIAPNFYLVGRDDFKNVDLNLASDPAMGIPSTIPEQNPSKQEAAYPMMHTDLFTGI